MGSKILCAKIMYAKGMRWKEFSDVYQEILATESGMKYFDKLSSNVQEFRSLNYLYSLIIENYKNFSAKSKWRKRFSLLFKKQSAKLTFDFDKFIDDMEDVNTMLNEVAVKSNALLRTVYKELQPGIPYAIFRDIMYIPDVTDAEAWQMKKMINADSMLKSVVFPKYTFFNFNQSKWLCSDVTFMQTYATVSGTEVMYARDTSSIADCATQDAPQVVSFTNGFRVGSVISKSELEAFDIVILDVSQLPASYTGDSFKLQTDMCKAASLANAISIAAQAISDVPGQRIAILTCSIDSVDKSELTNSAATFVIPTPTPPAIFKAIRLNRYSNTLLFSRNNRGAEDKAEEQYPTPSNIARLVEDGKNATEEVDLEEEPE